MSKELEALQKLRDLVEYLMNLKKFKTKKGE